MEALEHFLNIRPDQSPSTATLLPLIELVLNINTFQFNGNHYQQIKGIAMGACIGPSVACLTVGYIERNMLRDSNHASPFYLNGTLMTFLVFSLATETILNSLSITSIITMTASDSLTRSLVKVSTFLT